MMTTADAARMNHQLLHVKRLGERLGKSPGRKLWRRQELVPLPSFPPEARDFTQAFHKHHQKRIQQREAMKP